MVKVKKFLVGFGGFLILLGAGGMINHISMAYKAIKEESEMYGGSVQFMVLQLVGSLGPYLTSLIGGGLIIAIAAFISEYQKRSEITSELVHLLSNQKQVYLDEGISKPVQAKTEYQEKNASSDDFEPTNEQDDEERLFWNG